MQSLQGKVALVTGGTTGIGRESAVTFAKAGAKVVVTGRRETEGQETVRLIQEAGSEGLFMHRDMTQESDIEMAVKKAVDQYGHLDIALNNAGVEITGPLTEATRSDYDKIFDVNVWGVLASMKHEVLAMQSKGGGSIINLSSIAGQVGLPGLSIYVASKHAVEGMTKVAALEYAQQGIRVNAVAPALIETDMADRLTEGADTEQREAMRQMHPIGRTGKPHEVAAAILWLASDDSSFVTGTSLNVDGGFTAR